VTQAVLVHSDFHYENLLQQNGQLSGLLDFEWAFAGDPAADFATAPTRAAMLPGSETTFVAGYQSVRPFDAEHSYRATLYRLFIWLEGAVQEAHQNNRAGAAAALAQMVELLDELERRAQI
jgi:aminoglycoside phosphotransferase (APT) family kinase protein